MLGAVASEKTRGGSQPPSLRKHRLVFPTACLREPIVVSVLSFVKPHARCRQRHQLKYSRPFHPGLVVGGFEHVEREREFVVTEVFLELADFDVAQRFCYFRQIGSCIEQETFRALP